MFLKEEQKLFDTDRRPPGPLPLSSKLRLEVAEWDSARRRAGAAAGEVVGSSSNCWTKPTAACRMRIARKMLNHLCWIGVEEARRLLAATASSGGSSGEETVFEANRPSRTADWSVRKRPATGEIFAVASRSLSDEEIFEQIQKWVRENRAGFLVQALENLRHQL